MSDQFRDRAQRQAKRGNSWFPEIGEMLVGKLTGIKDVETMYGEAQVALIENEDDGQIVSVILGTVLANQFEKQEIKIGERVAITYFGKVDKYKDYSVSVDRPEAPKGIKSKFILKDKKKKDGNA